MALIIAPEGMIALLSGLWVLMPWSLVGFEA